MQSGRKLIALLIWEKTSLIIDADKRREDTYLSRNVAGSERMRARRRSFPRAQGAFVSTSQKSVESPYKCRVHERAILGAQLVSHERWSFIFVPRASTFEMIVTHKT